MCAKRAYQAAIPGIDRESQVDVFGEAEFRSTRGGSRKISAVSQ